MGAWTWLLLLRGRLYEVIHTAAVKVFGVVGKPNPRLPSGRLKNSRYDKHCKEGHQKLQPALRQNDSHAAEEYKKEFRRQKCKWKRVYDKKVQEKMLPDPVSIILVLDCLISGQACMHVTG